VGKKRAEGGGQGDLRMGKKKKPLKKKEQATKGGHIGQRLVRKKTLASEVMFWKKKG